MQGRKIISAIVYFFLFGSLAAQGTSKQNNYPAFSQDTKWRGVFTLRPGVEVPINFLLTSGPGGIRKLYLLNGDEKFDAGRLVLRNDSVYVSLDQFSNELALKYEANELKGVLRKQNGAGVPIPISAEINRTDRFEDNGKKPAADLSGTYDVRFLESDGKEEKAVGLFTQEGNRLKATFMRINGDSRYLDGIVEGNEFHLSSFIGSSPVYYHGSFDKGRNIQGEIVGARTTQKFSGFPDANAALPDAYKLTRLKANAPAFDFTFPDLKGRPVSLHDERFRNKVVIVTIGGTWCPNCMDETAFLAPWYLQNRARGVEVIALQYERQADSAYAGPAIRRYRERYNVQYEQLIAGIADKQKVSESLPMLTTFLSFPTTIFLGKDGKVAKIHTGFTGPATGKYYEAFKKEFEAEVDALLRQ